MGWIEIISKDKIEVLGDYNQYKRSKGQPYRTQDGRLKTQEEIDKLDKLGE